MLDWLRYFPIAFREAKVESLTPKGPYFAKLRPQRWGFGDSRFTFKAPWVNGVWGIGPLGFEKESNKAH